MDKYRKRYTVTSAQMDADFKMSARGVAQLFQDCFASYMATYRCAAFDLRERRMMWIISDFTFSIAGPLPLWGDSMDIELWLPDEPEFKVPCDYRFIRNGRTVIEGTSNWAILDIATRQPVPARSVLERQQIISEHAVERRRPRFTFPSVEPQTYEHLTNSSDTDFNSHISNLTYLTVALDALPVEYVKSHCIARVSMRFLHESFLGDRLKVMFAENGNATDSWSFRMENGKDETCCQACIEFCISTGASFGNDSEIRNQPTA